MSELDVHLAAAYLKRVSLSWYLAAAVRPCADLALAERRECGAGGPASLPSVQVTVSTQWCVCTDGCGRPCIHYSPIDAAVVMRLVYRKHAHKSGAI